MLVLCSRTSDRHSFISVIGVVLGLTAVADLSLGMIIEPLRKVHVSKLSNQDFDSTYLDKRPVIITGATVCPRGLNFDNIDGYCDGSVTGNYVRTKDHDGAGQSWAGLKAGDEKDNVDFVEFAKGMGNNEDPRFMFDVPMVEVCPALLNDIRIPSQFVNTFASQFLWRHLPDSDPWKCENVPFFNLYLAEGGFETDLHVDSAHTAFVASMCDGRKRWRVMTTEDFASLHSQMSFTDEGRQVNGTWIMSDVQRPFKTWSDDSPLNSMDDVIIYEGILEPGEIIYIPPGAPHAANTLDQSIMVASNDQSIKSLRNIVDYCDDDKNSWPGCSRFRERFSTVEDNFARFAPNNVREEMSFAQSFNCEKAIEQLAQSRLEISPLNFMEELKKGPLIIMKYVRSCVGCIQFLNLVDGDSFDPPLRLGVLNCPRGHCPRGESKQYQKILTMARGEYPEFVYVAPSTRNAPAIRGSPDDNRQQDLEVTVSHYYGPLEIDFLRVWISIKTGSTVDVSPFMWKAFIVVCHKVNGATVLFLQACGVPPMADDAMLISAFIVILLLLPCIGSCYTRASNGQKRKSD